MNNTDKKKFQPCEYTIRATALGISPIYFDKFVKTHLIEKIYKLNISTIKDICKNINIKFNDEKFSAKDFISIIDFSINAKIIQFDKTTIKSQLFSN